MTGLYKLQPQLEDDGSIHSWLAWNIGAESGDDEIVDQFFMAADARQFVTRARAKGDSVDLEPGCCLEFAS